MSCEVNVWNARNGRRVMRQAYDGVASPVGRIGIKTIRPDHAFTAVDASSDRLRLSSLQLWKSKTLCFEKFSTFI